MGGCEGGDVGRPEQKSVERLAREQAQFSLKQDSGDQPHLGSEFTEKTKPACKELKHCKKQKKSQN